MSFIKFYLSNAISMLQMLSGTSDETNEIPVKREFFWMKLF